MEASQDEEINDEFLLQCVANYRPLYDKIDKGFKSVILKENCWSSVARSLHTTVPAVKSRFKALREKYRRELIIDEKLSRSGAPSSCRPSWSLMSFFKFMYKYGQEDHRSTMSNLESESDDPPNAESDSFVEEIIIETESPRTTMETPIQKKRKVTGARSELEKNDNVLTDVSSAIRTINQGSGNKCSDKYDHFGQYLTQELRDMNEPYSSILMENIQLEIIKYKRSLRQNAD